MNKNSNTYIIIYATVMVVIVALILGCASMALKPRQDANVVNEMKGAILLSIGQGQDMNTVKDKTEYIDSQYAKYITEGFAIDYKGDVVAEADAFELLRDLKSVYDKAEQERFLPVFVSRDDAGIIRYILPVRGSGLWGPVWGYVALESDWDTIFGVVFDHQGETPGLGAEIATPFFQNQFQGKSIFAGDQLVGITVMKGTGSSSGNQHAVDAISGGTITSRAVEDMIKKCLKGYGPYIAKVKTQMGEEVLPGEGLIDIDEFMNRETEKQEDDE